MRSASPRRGASPCTPSCSTERATDVLSTVRQLGFLQLDPISTVAPPQHLVLWSRLGDRYDPAELDRLLWEERQLVEWDAFLYPDRGPARCSRRACGGRTARTTAG